MGKGLRLAMELILLTFLVRFFSMSSRLLPCVSGTEIMTKNRPARHMAPNIQNVMALPSPVMRSVNVLVTTNVHVQLNPVTIEAAEPRILAVKDICLIEQC